MIMIHHLLLLLLLPFTTSLPNPNPTHLSTTPFSAALAALQTHINYTFNNPTLLRRAMTHPSFSAENHRALALLGLHAVRSTTALLHLSSDPDLPVSALAHRVQDCDRSCASDARRLGVDHIVRVSPGTDAGSGSVLCGAFRGLFGAVAVDSGGVDRVGEVYRRVHAGAVGAMVLAA